MEIELDPERIHTTMIRKLSEKFAVSTRISEEMLANSTIEVMTNVAETGVAAAFTTFLRKTILSGKPIKKNTETIKVPASWRDHVLDRFLPKRARRLRGRIKYRAIEVAVTIYNVCPHIAVSPGTDMVPHLKFLDSPDYWDDIPNNAFYTEG